MERSDLEQWKSREVARLLALVETERRYWQEIVSTLPVCLAVLNSQLILMSANRAFRTRFGVRSEDLRTKRMEQILPFPELAIQVAKTLENRVSLAAPLILDTGEGKRLRVTVQPHRDWDEDTSLQALLVIEDLSVTGEAVQVSAAAQLAAAMPAALPAVVWTAELPSLRFLSVSESSVALTGLAVDRWLEAGFWTNRFAEADREAMVLHYNNAIAGGGMHSFEFRFDGNPRWFRETIRVDEGGSKVYGVLTDVTERHTLEEHILQSQRMDALSGFSGRAAHDLNNPLMIVGGYGEELFESLDESDPRRNDMAQLLAAAKRIGDIAASLQSFSRKAPNTGGGAFPDLCELLTRTVERMRVTAGPSLSIDFEAPAPGLLVNADEPLLQSMIYEVTAALADGEPEVQLAVQAREGYVRDVSLRDQLPPGMYAILAIENRGSTGTAAASRKPLFESIIPGKEGSGLGPALARAYRQVEAWGGSVWSSPDGRCVRILLHAQKSATEPAATAPATAQSEPPPVPIEPPKRIMVVDDEMGIRSLMRKILVRNGYAVKEAGNAQEALAILEKEPVDLLLTDVVMPDITGRELAERVVTAHPMTRVLYVSGFTGETLVESGQYPPGSQLLQKPFTLGSLLKKVKEVLSS